MSISAPIPAALAIVLLVDVAAATAPDVTVMIRDVRELVGFLRIDEKMRRLPDVEPEKMREEFEKIQGEFDAAHATVDAFALAIRTFGEPAFDGKRARVESVEGGRLVVAGEAGHHAWVDGFLAAQQTHTAQILFQARFFRTPKGTPATQGLERSSQVLDATGRDELVAGLLATEGVELLTAPKVLTPPGRECQVVSIEQVAYIKDFEVVIVQPGDVEIADPIVDVLEDGVTLTMRGVPLPDGTYGVSVTMEHVDVLRPIKTMTMLVGSGRHEVTISLPELRKVALRSHLALSPGQSLAIVSPDQEQDIDYVLLLDLDEIPGRGR